MLSAYWPIGKRSWYRVVYLLMRSFKMILFLSICFWAYILSCLILVLDYGSRWFDYILVINYFSSLISFFIMHPLPLRISFGYWPLCGLIIISLCQSASAWRRSSAWSSGSWSDTIRIIYQNLSSFCRATPSSNHYPLLIYL